MRRLSPEAQQGKRPGFMGLHELDAERVANRSINFEERLVANRFPGDARLILLMLPVAIIAGCAVAAANYWLGWFAGMKW